MSHTPLPLTSRPLDLIYFLFFLIHIPATLLLDIQSLYPPQFVPDPLKGFITWYLQWSADPLVAAAFDLNGPPASWAWFKSFLILEAVFQLPVFLVGLHALWKDSRTCYPLLLIYSASSATTIIPCVSTILHTTVSSIPVPASRLTPFNSAAASSLSSSLETAGISITPEQRNTLLANYVPFLLVLLVMCVDMAVRVAGLVAAGLRASEKEKGSTRGKKTVKAE